MAEKLIGNEAAPNKKDELLRELGTRTDGMTVEYSDGNEAHEKLLMRVTGNVERLKTYFTNEHPLITRYRILRSTDSALGGTT